MNIAKFFVGHASCLSRSNPLTGFQPVLRVLTAVLILAATSFADDPSGTLVGHAFLKKHCVHCHDASTESKARTFVAFRFLPIRPTAACSLNRV